MAEWLREMSVGEWYATDGDPFEIVGVDTKAEIVLVQHFDGTLEEYDFDSWLELAARPTPPPEDYSGALDIERGDYTEESDGHADGLRWNDPLDFLDSR
ncbi:MAG: DUF6763 family protein [Pseudomonadota bacterium]